MIDFDVGHPEINPEHQALIRLIEKVEDVCGYQVRPDCTCDQCPKEKSRHCFDSLMEVGHEVMVRLLEHFHHEEALMESLPENRSKRAHCAEHRREHVNFSTQYNRAVTRIDASQPVIGLRAVHLFILDWIRGHVLEYDTKLAAPLKSHSKSDS